MRHLGKLDATQARRGLDDSGSLKASGGRDLGAILIRERLRDSTTVELDQPVATLWAG